MADLGGAGVHASVEQQLAESEARYRALAESMLEGFAYCRMFYDDEGHPVDWEYLAVNTAFTRITGLEDVVGKRVLEILPTVKEDTPELFEAYGRVAATGEPEEFEILFTPLNMWLRVTAIRPEPDHFVAFFEDITDHKRLEQERLVAEKFFRDTFEHAEVGIAHVDPADGTYLRVNQRLSELLGYTREELLGTGVTATTHPDDVAQIRERLRELRTGEEETYSGDRRYLRKDGSTLWVHVGVTAIRTEDGKPDYNLVAFTDMSARVQAEDALRESEEKFRNLFNNAEIGMFRTKADGSAFLDLNDKYLEILGYTREELIGKPTANIWVDPREREAMVRTLEEIGHVDDLEFDLLNKQGDVRRCLTSLKLYRDAGILDGSIIDITERKRAQELLAQQALRIERTLTSVIDIASNIVELRDPYTAGHQRRVSELAVKMAERLGMSGHEVDDIRVAGLLHDMGKTAIPTEILTKPGALSLVEFTLVKEHPDAGHRLAVSANLAEPIAEMIFEHHERCDGSGYPRGLTGDQVLMGAKVLAVADVVEAMMSHRPYRPALGVGAALAEIERGAGTLYDAWVSEACMRVFNEDGFEFAQ